MDGKPFRQTQNNLFSYDFLKSNFCTAHFPTSNFLTTEFRTGSFIITEFLSSTSLSADFLRANLFETDFLLPAFLYPPLFQLLFFATDLSYMQATVYNRFSYYDFPISAFFSPFLYNQLWCNQCFLATTFLTPDSFILHLTFLHQTFFVRLSYTWFLRSTIVYLTFLQLI